MKTQTREVLRSVANTIEALSREPHNTTAERQHLHTAAAALWCAIDSAHVQAQLAALPSLIADARAKLDAEEPNTARMELDADRASRRPGDCDDKCVLCAHASECGA